MADDYDALRTAAVLRRETAPDEAIARRASTASYHQVPLDGGTRSYDPVTAPAHYTSSGIETIDAIEAWRLDYHLGNVVKYVSRAGKKGLDTELEDLKKARWYLDRAIAKRGGQ